MVKAAEDVLEQATSTTLLGVVCAGDHPQPLVSVLTAPLVLPFRFATDIVAPCAFLGVTKAYNALVELVDERLCSVRKDSGCCCLWPWRDADFRGHAALTGK